MRNKILLSEFILSNVIKNLICSVFVATTFQLPGNIKYVNIAIIVNHILLFFFSSSQFNFRRNIYLKSNSVMANTTKHQKHYRTQIILVLQHYFPVM